MRIRPDETIALVIDYQEKLVPVISEKELLISNTTRLLKGLDLLQVPMIFTQQYTKGLGMTISELTELTTTPFTYYDKITFSSAMDPTITEAIEASKCKNIIVCGIEAHICVIQTVIDLQANGYQVYLISDCISSRKEYDKKTALKRAVSEGALLSTYESILFELTVSALNPAFKSISNTIK